MKLELIFIAAISTLGAAHAHSVQNTGGWEGGIAVSGPRYSAVYHRRAPVYQQQYYGGAYAGVPVVYESSTTVVSGPGYNATYQQQAPVYQQQYYDGECTIEKYQVTGRCF